MTSGRTSTGATRRHLIRQACREWLYRTFNGRLLYECLNVLVFFTLADTRESSRLGAWTTTGSGRKMAIGDQPPSEFADEAQSRAPLSQDMVALPFPGRWTKAE
jgi:hypothetical protein